MQLFHEDDHRYHIQKPDGSKVIVAKRGLSEKLHSQIKALKMADGGEVPEEAPVEQAALDAPVDSAPASAPPQFVSAQGTIDVPDTVAEPQAQAPTETQQSPTQVTAQPVAAAASFGGLGNPQQIIGQESAGIQKAAKAQSEGAAREAKIYEDFAQQSKQQTDRYLTQMAALDKEQAGLQDAVKNGHLDPNRMYKDMGTGNKILAGIGMILSGAGAGLTGRPNMALEVLQRAQEKDIEAQKYELGKAPTLYSMNLHKYQSQSAADAATRLQMNTSLQAQIAQSAARTGSDQALANAQVAIGQLKMQALPYMQTLAVMGLKNQVVSGEALANSPLDQAMIRLDPKYAEKRVIVGNRVYEHTSGGKAADEMRVFEQKLSPIQHSITRLDELGPSALVPGSRAYNEAHAIRASLSTEIAGLKSTEIGSSRINNEEAQQALESIKDPTSFKQLINGGVRNQEFFKHLGETAESMRHQSLIGYKGLGSVPFTPMHSEGVLPLNKTNTKVAGK